MFYRKSVLIAWGFCSLLFWACAENSHEETQLFTQPSLAKMTIDAQTLPLSEVNKGILHIRLTKETAEKLALQTNQTVAMSSVPTQLFNVLQSIGTTEMEPLFPIDPRWKKRMLREGLNQWYIVRFNEKTELKTAMNSLKNNAQVEWIEPSYLVTTFKFKTIQGKPKTILANQNQLPFNDPGLIDQWHYNNDGIRLEKSVKGADINLFEAWQHETGKPNVIVSVVDGGIDTSHEDLIDNLWVNEGEIPDDGIDNDNNGFIDDIHGFDFLDRTGKISPDPGGHGTHVAGTIAARNNNGIGVSGIAGGNGQKNSGVKLMSCQVFRGRSSNQNTIKPNDRKEESDELITNIDQNIRGMVYGANNGAVISQNSWGYRFPGIPELPADVKAAIEYFRKYAGCDNDGNQLPNSPMKGGVVIFAGGNDGTDYLCYPAAYPPTIAVASMGPNWIRASYSNRGAWVDITAPGGDKGFSSEAKGSEAGEIYSTLPENRYGFMAGTSMACPHVSGVAALAVSKFGKQGFTASQLEDILLVSLRPQNINQINAEVSGRLGRGYIDAGSVFATDQKKAPDQVTHIETTVAWTTARLSWKAVTDPDDRLAAYYRIYTSKQPITQSALQTLKYESVNSLGISPGDAVEFLARNLEDDTDYYIGIVGVDRWGNIAQVKVEKIKTKKNHSPEFQFDEKVKLRASIRQRAKISIPVSDADGHLVSVNLSGEGRGVSHTFKDNILTISIAKIAPVGKYNINATATDQFGKATSLTIPFEIYDYVEPKFISEQNNQNASLPVAGVQGSPQIFNLKNIISASEGADLTYSLNVVDESVLKATIDASGILTLKGVRQGKTQVRITISDGISQPATKTFEVLVANNVDNVVYSMYPIPATRDLNLIVNAKVKKAFVEIISTTGRTLISQEIAATNGKLKIDVRNLTPASYTIKLKTDIGAYSNTFVKL